VERLVTLRVPLGDEARDGLAHRALPRAIGGAPGQSDLLARCADDTLGKLVHDGPVVLLERVCPLRLDVVAAELDRIELVLADAPAKDLFFPHLVEVWTAFLAVTVGARSSDPGEVHQRAIGRLPRILPPPSP
jgi:hypothetical protein